MATPNLGYQNFFSTTLSSTITASDTTIYLNSLPTPSEGYLVIEPDSTTNREIIYYTSKGANFVTCPSVAAGRGVGGTSAASHSSGVTVQMNNNAELWTSLQDGSANTGMHQWFDDSFADYIKSGGTITQATGLIASVSSGVAYINGRRLTFNAFSKQVTPAKDTYFDIVAPSSTDNIATVSYVELASGVTGSVPTSNGIHLGMVNSASSSISTIYQAGQDRLGYKLYLNNASHDEAGWTAYTPIWTNLTVGSGSNAGWYKQIGKTVIYRGRFVMGAGSSVGSNPLVSLPVPLSTNYVTTGSAGHFIGTVHVLDSGTANFVCFPLVNATSTLNNFQPIATNTAGTYASVAAFSSTVPMTWTTNDEISWTVVYEAA